MAQLKNGEAGNDKNKQRDRTLRSYSAHNQIRPRSLLERLTTMSDVRAAQIVAIFGTLWMMLIWLQMLNGTPLGEGSTAMAEIAFRQSVPSP
jgi:hypothetical protein